MALPAQDDFNRSDANPIGGNWTTSPGFAALKISSSAVTGASTGDNAAYWNPESWPNDQWAQAKLTAFTAAEDAGPAVRLATEGSTKNGYWFDVGPTGTTCPLFRYLAGTAVNIATLTYTPQVNDVFRIDAAGATVIGFINNVCRVLVADTNLASGAAGLFFFEQDGTKYDDWIGADVKYPIFRAAGAVATGSTSLSVAMPTGTVQGDVMIMAVATHQTGITESLPANWTVFAKTASTNGTGFFAWKRAGSSEAGPYSVTGLADSSCGAIATFRNCLASGDPIHASAGRANASGANGTGGITTTISHCLIISGACVMDNLGLSAWTGATNPRALLERFDGGTTTGSDTQVGIATAPQIVAGETGATAYTHTSFENVGLVCALLGLAIGGTSNKTLGTLTCSAAGTVSGAGGITGTLNKTLGALTSTAAGTVKVTGSSAKTLGALTSTAAGTVKVTGSSAKTLGAMASTAVGTIKVTGTVAKTLGAATVTAAGTVSSGVSGTLNQALGGLGLVAGGQVTVRGTTSRTLPPLTIDPGDGVGHVSVSGSFSKTLGALAITASGTAPTHGTCTATLGTLTLTSTGTVSTGTRIGTLDKTLPGLSIDPGDGVGSVSVSGTLARSLGPLASQASEPPPAAITPAPSGALTTSGAWPLVAVDFPARPTRPHRITPHFLTQGRTTQILGPMTLRARGRIQSHGLILKPFSPMALHAQGQIMGDSDDDLQAIAATVLTL